MYEPSLTQIGLSYAQSVVYETLLKNGRLTAGKIALKTPYKRGLVYKTLEDLVKMELIDKKEEPKKVAIFEVKHPLELKDFAEKKEQQAKDAKMALQGMISSLVSEYNLVSGRPGIKFYEGIEGIKEVIYDTFTSDEVIYTYSDPESVEKYIKKINDQYTRERDKRKLNKKIIFPDSPLARKLIKNYHKQTTEMRIMPVEKNFVSIMQIYSNKISYITLSDKNKIGVIIENESIYEMHKLLFEFNWENSIKID